MIAAVSSSMPRPSCAGLAAIRASSRPNRFRWVKCWSTIAIGSSPSPWDTWPIRNFGVAPPLPNDTMCADRMLAPAEVPATSAPRRWAARMASPSGVPTTIVASLT